MSVLREQMEQDFMTIYLLVFLAASVLLLLIYKYDMYDREPWFMVLLAIFLGGLSAWVVGDAEDWAIGQSTAFDSIAIQAFIASSFEETCKLAVVLVIVFGFRRWFNDPMDGIVYGAMAGLGFALEESRFYLDLVLRTAPRPSDADLFGQEGIRLILHFLTGGLGGFGIGLIVSRIRQGKVILVGWLGAALVIHFLWDYACGLPQGDNGAVFQRSTAVVLMLFALLLFGIAVRVGNQWSATVHPPKGKSPPLFGWPFNLLFGKKRK